MLTSSSQYLHPDYLQPLPTTLDAKKSPLALLAQTCSSIGKDTTPSKSIIPPIEKKAENGTSKSASPKSPHEDKGPTSSSSEKRTTSPAGSDKGSQRSAPKDIPPLVPISSSSTEKQSRSSSSDNVRCKSSDGRRSATPSAIQTSSSATTATSSNSRISLSCGNMLLEVNHNESASSLLKPAAHPPSLASLRPDLLSQAPGALPPTLGYPGCALPLLGHPVPVDPSSLNALHPQTSVGSSLLSSKGLLSSGAHSLHGAPGMSPYSYARVKTATGGTTLVPICRDPYCTNCQVTMQNAHLTATCAAGCTQCNHEKSFSVPTSHSGLNPSLAGLSMFSLTPGAASLAAASANPLASSLYSHAFGVLPGHHTLPYVCNWVAGSDYCGKRFNTSEELLQHLRTHTSSSDTSNVAAAYHALGLAAPSPFACPTSHYPTPGSLSPNTLRQAYQRSLSPNTLLAASRYHPYKSPLSSLPGAAPGVGVPTSLPSALPSALPPYYPPYALYGSRLGAAVAP